MNRLKKRCFLFGLLPLLSGCIVRSLHPLYTDENVIFEEGLVGQWMEEGSKEVWESGALQTFWLAHLNTEGAFDELSNFQRSRSTQ